MLLEKDHVDSTRGCVCRKFKADVFLLNHTGQGVRKGIQVTLYAASMMQNATVEDIEGKVWTFLTYLYSISRMGFFLELGFTRNRTKGTNYIPFHQTARVYQKRMENHFT